MFEPAKRNSAFTKASVLVLEPLLLEDRKAILAAFGSKEFLLCSNFEEVRRRIASSSTATRGEDGS